MSSVLCINTLELYCDTCHYIYTARKRRSHIAQYDIITVYMIDTTTPQTPQETDQPSDTNITAGKKDTKLPSISLEEKKFCNLVSKGVSLTTSYRQAFPHKNKLAYDTIRRYASELYAKKNIQTEVATTRERSALMARLAEDRLEQILTDDDSLRKGSKVAEVAMFMYDHANGKATQQIESKSMHVAVTYNLGGADAPPIPPEVLAQLEQ